MYTKLWSENLKCGDHPEDLDVDGNGSYENRVGSCGLDASGSG
jgi:hypothetical protein